MLDDPSCGPSALVNLAEPSWLVGNEVPATLGRPALRASEESGDFLDTDAGDRAAVGLLHDFVGLDLTRGQARAVVGAGGDRGVVGGLAARDASVRAGLGRNRVGLELRVHTVAQQEQRFGAELRDTRLAHT